MKDDPKASRDDVDISRWIDDVPKVVFSRTLREVTWKNARLAKGVAAEEVAALKRAPGKDILIQNSTRLTRSLLEAGLVGPDCTHLRQGVSRNQAAPPFVHALSDTGSGEALASGVAAALGSFAAMSCRRCMPAQLTWSAASSAQVRAFAIVAPSPTTARTRPPLVRYPPSGPRTVPAWKTVAPDLAASSRPEMASPLRGVSG